MIWMGEVIAGEVVPIRAQFHDGTGTAADPTSPAARMEGPSAGTFADLTAPTKRDSKTGYYGTDIDTTGYAAGIRVVRVAGTVGTLTVGAVYGFRVVTARGEQAKTAADTAASNATTAGAKADAAKSSADAAGVLAADASSQATLAATNASTAATAATGAQTAAEALPTAAEIDQALSASHGSGTWGADTAGMATITESTQDDAGAEIGRVTKGGVAVSGATVVALVDGQQRGKPATTDGDGGFTLVVPLGATYTLRIYDDTTEWPDKVVTV